MKSLKQQAKEAAKFVMVTTQYSSPIFIADTEKTGGLEITDREEEAQIWSDGFDNTKIQYWRAVTGWNLEIKYLTA